MVAGGSGEVSLCAISVESSDKATHIPIPSEYRHLQVFFSKTRATCLPVHCPWDCTIDLLPGSTLLRGHIYPLSHAETEAMEVYVQEALAQGFLRPSTSLTSSSFLFMKKKDRGLHPCIDYRTLNKTTVKFSYPLPHTHCDQTDARCSVLYQIEFTQCLQPVVHQRGGMNGRPLSWAIGYPPRELRWKSRGSVQYGCGLFNPT